MNHIANEAGCLYLVATPIGNLEDITLRALRVLREVDLIAAEDTRHSRKLLAHYDIHTPLTSYHQHNEKAKGEDLLEKMLAGTKLALISDAGMPGISDPGHELVLKAVQAGLRVIPVPGPSASLAALVVSGLPTDRFVFEGFLPRGAKAKKAVLEGLQNESRTIILYEAPHRLLSTLRDLYDFLGDRDVALVREISKIHEEIQRGKLGSLVEYYGTHAPKGEFTLIIKGKENGEKGIEVSLDALLQEVFKLEGTGKDRKAAIKEVAQKYKLPKRELYKAVVEALEKDKH
ncbi:16S rRNA (cytidine(1402)-2'-O)-methyltransferase [Zhaonella formicivorans]|uniref:16S rRNA (cytidine(1402)-2'-O)-methyltransferase n=1 Tax=Zhaonella formicivorans TaxID=2528593 RepID=UPI0010D30FF5|nr:16S rRNA (cytidine(1402)-2'-O)-methyltransferase [Zhaonella formicivorans]